MHSITIGTEHRAAEIIQRLDEEFRFLQDEGLAIDVGHFTRGKFTFVDCSVRPSRPDAAAQFRHYLASALSDFIVEKWESDLIRKLVREHYYYFSQGEQERIGEYALNNLASRDPTEAGPQQKLQRKSRILHRLRDYLDQEQELVVEGFVNFRLPDYLEELEDAVDRAVDDFLIEREHHEFIRLLKYFVEAQAPRLEEVHVITGHHGHFELVDGAGTALGSEILAEFVSERTEAEVNHEDLLISALITLAPQRLIVHAGAQAQWGEAIATLQGVFSQRLQFCSGCTLCTGTPDSDS